MKKKELSTFLTCLTLMSLSLVLIATACSRDPSSGDPCRVVFHTGEGEGTAPYPKTVAEGNVIELPGQETMTHPSGKILSKWMSDDGTIYNPYYRYTVTRNVEFTAQWIASTSIFTVTFSANNGIGTPPESKSVQAGSNITLPNEGGLSRTGYTFGGWNTDASGTGINYSVGSPFTPISDITLYARWNAVSPTTPTVTSVTVSPASASVAKGSTQTFSATVTGSNYPAQTVTWSIDQSDSIDSGTTIDASGSLAVSASESLLSLTVRATSTVDTTKFGEATVTVTATLPTVTSVTVTPVTASVVKGKTQSFGATVTGTNNPAQTVTWSILNTNKNSGTTITNGGYLTVSASETLTVLTVRATSTDDTSKFGEATVNVFALAAPTGVKAETRSTSSIYIEWLPVAGAATYDVYYDIVGVSSAKQKVATRRAPAELFHLHTLLQNNTTYRYYIKAINSSDGESDYSDPSNDATTGRY